MFATGNVGDADAGADVLDGGAPVVDDRSGGSDCGDEGRGDCGRGDSRGADGEGGGVCEDGEIADGNEFIARYLK